MKDEDRRDNFLLYNPIEMSKLRDNYTVPSNVSECKRWIDILLLPLLQYLMFTFSFIRIKNKSEIWNHVRNICFGKIFNCFLLISHKNKFLEGTKL